MFGHGYMHIDIYHSLGKVHSWNFSCEKFHVKIFSSSLFIHVLNFHPSRLQTENFFTANFSQTTVCVVCQVCVCIQILCNTKHRLWC